MDALQYRGGLCCIRKLADNSERRALSQLNPLSLKRAMLVLISICLLRRGYFRSRTMPQAVYPCQCSITASSANVTAIDRVSAIQQFSEFLGGFKIVIGAAQRPKPGICYVVVRIHEKCFQLRVPNICQVQRLDYLLLLEEGTIKYGVFIHMVPHRREDPVVRTSSVLVRKIRSALHHFCLGGPRVQSRHLEETNSEQLTLLTPPAPDVMCNVIGLVRPVVTLVKNLQIPTRSAVKISPLQTVGSTLEGVCGWCENTGVWYQ
jgi:hypothetical protein